MVRRIAQHLLFSWTFVCGVQLLTVACSPQGTLGNSTLESDSTTADSRTNHKNYQTGDEWGKLPVTSEVMERAPAAYRRVVSSTARTNYSTSFVLGEFDGQIVMATNHHVFPSVKDCIGETVRFEFLNIDSSCARFIGTWQSIELSLFTIEIKDRAQRQRVLDVAANFDYNAEIRQGQELLTVGFGFGNNPSQQLVANSDKDCKVFSPSGRFRFMADPDPVQPNPYKTWGFANGCDVSHGDSGSAVVDRTTGLPIGIMWTIKSPKTLEIQNSNHLATVLARQTEEVWTELSYAAPAQKIREVLTAALDDGSIGTTDRSLVKSLVMRGR